MFRFLWQWRTRNKQTACCIALVVIAAVLAALAVWHGPAMHISVGGVLAFAALVLAAELMAVRLPQGGAVSVSLAISLAAFAIFPARWAVTANALGVVAAKVLRRRSLDVILFNAAQIALSTVSGLSVFGLLNPAGMFVYPVSVVPFLVGSFAYVLVNLSLNSGILLVEGKGSFWDIWWFNLRATLLPFLTLTALALLLVVVYISPLRALGVVLLFVPLALARYSLLEYVKLRESHVETIEALAAALDARDQYTKGHSDRVAELATAVAQQLQLRPGAIEEIRFAALLHDLGKVGVRDDLLNKPGRLTVPELETIRSHARLGADIIQKVSFLREVSRMVRYHHQWYDGGGYPGGLSGRRIPLGSRILTVCDAWDAMTTDRVYRKALTPLRALNELQRGAGTQFDPAVVEAFGVVARRLGMLQTGADSAAGEVAAAVAATAATVEAGVGPAASGSAAGAESGRGDGGQERQSAQAYVTGHDDPPSSAEPST